MSDNLNDLLTVGGFVLACVALWRTIWKERFDSRLRTRERATVMASASAQLTSLNQELAWQFEGILHRIVVLKQRAQKGGAETAELAEVLAALEAKVAPLRERTLALTDHSRSYGESLLKLPDSFDPHKLEGAMTRLMYALEGSRPVAEGLRADLSKIEKALESIEEAMESIEEAMFALTHSPPKKEGDTYDPL